MLAAEREVYLEHQGKVFHIHGRVARIERQEQAGWRFHLGSYPVTWLIAIR